MRLPIDKSETVLQTEEEHERALIAACRAATVLEARGIHAADEAEEPLPASTIKLLKRLPGVRVHADGG